MALSGASRATMDAYIKVLILKANGKGLCSGHAIGNNAVDYPDFVEGPAANRDLSTFISFIMLPPMIFSTSS
jgi:hypothetical protein